MKLSGAKINFLGDSITEGCGTGGENYRFTGILSREFGILARNYGIGGTRYARQQIPSPNPITDRDFCLRSLEMDSDADAVVVFGGTNDYGHGDAPFGLLTDRSADSFCGACHVLFSGIKERFPNANILIITPLHRLNEENPKGDGTAMTPRLPLKDYVATIDTVAKLYSLPILDLYTDHTLDPNNPDICQTYVPDGLHPNDAGHRILAQRIAAALEAL